MIDYTRDADGKFLEVKIDGKKIMKSYLNALNKAVASGTFTMRPEGEYSVNGIYSSVEVTALPYSVYMWTKLWYSRYDMFTGAKKCPTPVQTYDNMRYLFMALCPSGYDLVS